MTRRIDPHQKAYVCKHIFEGSMPVLLVTREGGDRSFLCGGEHEDAASEYRVVGIGHLFERDSTLSELQDLPEGFEAERRDPVLHG